MDMSVSTRPDDAAARRSEAVSTSAFDWEDPLRLDWELTSEERDLRDATAAFAAAELAPAVSQAYENETQDPSVIHRMGQMGLLGITVPEEYGGLGSGYVAYGLAAREIERVDSGYRSMMSVQSSLVIYPILAYGSDPQRRTYLPGLVSGEKIGCFGLTEPDAGSDPGGMRTLAEPIAGG